MGDDIHKTHFQVPEMPYKRKEREAIILLQKILLAAYDLHPADDFDDVIYMLLGDTDTDLVDWVMKYKG